MDFMRQTFLLHDSHHSSRNYFIGSSLGAQIIKPIGHGKAKLQVSSSARNTAYIALTLFWFIGIGFFYSILGTWDIAFTHRLALHSYLHFLLRSSHTVVLWNKLGRRCVNHLHRLLKEMRHHFTIIHNAHQQVIARIVHLNTLAMPVVLSMPFYRSLQSSFHPNCSHTQIGIELPEYRASDHYGRRWHSRILPH